MIRIEPSTAIEFQYESDHITTMPTLEFDISTERVVYLLFSFLFKSFYERDTLFFTHYLRILMFIFGICQMRFQNFDSMREIRHAIYSLEFIIAKHPTYWDETFLAC